MPGLHNSIAVAASSGYALDPQLAAIVDAMPRRDGDMSLAERRAAAQRLVAQRPPYQAHRRLVVTDTHTPGSADAPAVPVRVYAPAERTQPLPALLYLHAGGFSAGGIEMVDTSARLIVDHIDVVVVNVDFRLAPEHPYPAGLDDSFAALEWLTSDEAASEHGVDTGKVAVLGESSGGNFAAALTLMARDRGRPRLAAQLLDAPTVDNRLDTPSMRAFNNAPFVTSGQVEGIWRTYLGDRIDEPGRAEAPITQVPGRASSAELTGLPPAWVVAYEIDPTRDGCLGYARALIEAGVPTDVIHYSGAFHLAHVIPGTAIAERMWSDRLAAIRRLLGAGTAEQA